LAVHGSNNVGVEVVAVGLVVTVGLVAFTLA